MLQASCLVCSTPFPRPAVAGERVGAEGLHMRKDVIPAGVGAPAQGCIAHL